MPAADHGCWLLRAAVAVEQGRLLERNQCKHVLLCAVHAPLTCSLDSGLGLGG
jgi:hypothetical protein